MTDKRYGRFLPQKKSSKSSKTLFPEFINSQLDADEEEMFFLSNPQEWEIYEDNEYRCRGGNIYEWVLVNESKKIIRTLYWTQLGGGEEAFALIRTTLSRLADQIDYYDRFHEDSETDTLSIRSLERALAPVYIEEKDSSVQSESVWGDDLMPTDI